MSVRTIRILGLVLAFAAAAGVAQAGWQQEISSFDAARLKHLAQSRVQGLAEAQAGGGTGDYAAIAQTLSPDSHGISASALLGTWRCRQIKLGGMTPYVVYSWFTCRIKRVDGGLFFQKVNGSQRTNGFLYPEKGAWVYLGAASVGNEPPHRYSGDGASVGAPATPDDQVGILTAISSRHLRLELPAPIQETRFDAIELKR
jgi:hypothetical protein